MFSRSRKAAENLWVVICFCKRFSQAQISGIFRHAILILISKASSDFAAPEMRTQFETIYLHSSKVSRVSSQNRLLRRLARIKRYDWQTFLILRIRKLSNFIMVYEMSKFYLFLFLWLLCATAVAACAATNQATILSSAKTKTSQRKSILPAKSLK